MNVLFVVPSQNVPVQTIVMSYILLSRGLHEFKTRVKLTELIHQIMRKKQQLQITSD